MYQYDDYTCTISSRSTTATKTVTLIWFLIFGSLNSMTAHSVRIKAQFLWRRTCSLVWGSPQPCVSDWWSPQTSPPRFLLWWWREFRTLKEGRMWAATFFTFVTGRAREQERGSFRVGGGGRCRLYLWFRCPTFASQEWRTRGSPPR